MKKKIFNLMAGVCLASVAACDSGSTPENSAALAHPPNSAESVAQLLNGELSKRDGGQWYAQAPIKGDGLIGSEYEQAVLEAMQTALAHIMSVACGDDFESVRSYSWRVNAQMRSWVDDQAQPPMAYLAVAAEYFKYSCH